MSVMVLTGGLPVGFLTIWAVIDVDVGRLLLFHPNTAETAANTPSPAVPQCSGAFHPPNCTWGSASCSRFVWGQSRLHSHHEDPQRLPEEPPTGPYSSHHSVLLQSSGQGPGLGPPPCLGFLQAPAILFKGAGPRGLRHRPKIVLGKRTASTQGCALRH